MCKSGMQIKELPTHIPPYSLRFQFLILELILYQVEAERMEQFMEFSWGFHIQRSNVRGISDFLLLPL